MKLVPMLSGVAMAVALSACADKSADVAVPTATPNGINTLSQQAIRQPNVSGTIWIKQKVALPPDAVLTVTLSDASLADAPSKVLAQRAVRTEGKQAPFSFVLPYNPSDVQPNARILLSAAVTINDKLVFITDTVQEAVNKGGTKIDLTTVPVQQTEVPVATQTNQPTLPTPNTDVIFLRPLHVDGRGRQYSQRYFCISICPAPDTCTPSESNA